VLDHAERQAMEVTVRRFADGIERTLFATEAADGDLSRVPALLAQARAIGLVTDPTPEAAGYEWGVWGRACLQEGVSHSLATLSTLGEVCAGFATAVHAQGLACLALDRAFSIPPAFPLAAAFTPGYGLALDLRNAAGGYELRVSDSGAGPQLDGSVRFLIAAERPQKLVCFARRVGGARAAEDDWVVALLDPGSAGVTLEPVTGRTGLRASHQYHLRCDRVAIPNHELLLQGREAWCRLVTVVACDWLGHAAIALGVARRALHDSRTYASTRYQGGAMVQEHAAVQLLQATAAYDIAVQDAILCQHGQRPLAGWEPEALLRWAIHARLSLVEHAHRAVTNCLQTLGGYGYMEDYGFEKRLRDVSTLKSLHGPPDQLKLLLNRLARREA
jgi:alkylation response protein AidB-like acyl-CoA dehydrogenase